MYLIEIFVRIYSHAKSIIIRKVCLEVVIIIIISLYPITYSILFAVRRRDEQTILQRSPVVGVCNSYKSQAPHSFLPCPRSGEQKLIKFSKETNDAIIKETAACVPPGEKLDDLLKVIRDGTYRDDDNFKNFLHCGYKNSGYVYADGTINVDTASQQFPDPAAMREVMLECDKNRGGTPTQNTFEYFKCFQKYSPFLMGLYA